MYDGNIVTFVVYFDNDLNTNFLIQILSEELNPNLKEVHRRQVLRRELKDGKEVEDYVYEDAEKQEEKN